MSLHVLDQILDVRREGRIRIDLVADLRRCDAKAHGQAKDVDQLLAGMADKVRTENLVGCLVDDDL